jgi:hypothetical protein
MKKRGILFPKVRETLCYFARKQMIEELESSRVIHGPGFHEETPKYLVHFEMLM